MAVIALYATMGGIARWTPKLGIDLAGGTSVTLTAKTTNGTPVTSSAMTQAKNIIQNRVDGLGVSGATVDQQGSDNIVVQIPGNNSQNIANTLGETAALTFRQVDQATPISATSTTSPSTSSSATATTTKSSTSATTTTSKAASTTTTQKDVLSNALKASSSATSTSTTASSTSTSTASSTATPTSSASSSAAAASCSFTKVPASAAASQTCATTLYNEMTCTPEQAGSFTQWPANYYMPACSTNPSASNPLTKYLLSPSSVSGKDVSSVTAIPQSSGGSTNQVLTGYWQIDLGFDAKGTSDFANITSTLAPNQGQLAIVLDGVVQSAPSINQGAITTGNATITGNFSETQANDIANVLKYGQLPLAFGQSDVSQVSASLAGTQLSGGLVAGAIGLALVFLYLVFYYRGLAAIAISSLFVSATLTYSLAVLLGPLIGFTLDLPGIAGLIVAIGINADSFVVFFERLRDEVREGRTLRTAVQRGWERARRTILSADFITFLAAAVLYEVSVGSVKGFAFTLGLTTVLDVVVVFLFTKPIVTLIARTKFFGNGHRWSGLDPERLGAKRSGRVPIVSRRGRGGTTPGTTDPTLEG